MRRRNLIWAVLALVVILLLVSQIPAVKDRLLWGWIQADAWTRGVLNPAGEIPTPLPTATGQCRQRTLPPPTDTPEPTSDSEPSPTPTETAPTPTPIPGNVYLPAA